MSRLKKVMAASLVTLFATSAKADVWTFAPRASLSTRYDENLRLIGNSNAGSSAGSVTAAGSLVRHDDDWKFLLQPLVSAVRYPEDELLDRDDIQISSALSKYFERSEWTLQSSFARDTTVISERGTSGLTQVNQPHERVLAALTPSFRLSSRWSMAGTLAWSNDSYPESLNVALVDYDYASVSARLNFAPTERSKVSIDAAFSELSTLSFESKTHQYTANLKFESALTERFTIAVGAGPVFVESGQVSDDGIGYDANLKYDFLSGAVGMSAIRDVTPNGRGVLAKRTQATVYVNRDWTARFGTDLSALWLESSEALPSLDVRFPVVRYASADASLRWRYTPTTSIGFSIGWSWQDQESFGTTAETYRAVMTVSWQGLEQSLR